MVWTGKPLQGVGFGRDEKKKDEPLRVQRREHTIEGVVAGNAVAQWEKGFEPVLLGLAEILHVVEGLAGAEQRADRNDQNVNEVMILGAIDARIGQVFEMFDQTEFGMILHPQFES